MKHFLDPTDHSEVLIPMYGTVHFITLLFGFALIAIMIWKKDYIKKLANNRSFIVKMTIVFIVIEVFYWFLLWFFKVEPKYERFPLHLCATIATILPILILLNAKKYWLRFFSYWALGAGFISFANPGFVFVEPFSFGFIHYLTRHYFVFLIPVFLQIGMNFKHNYKDFIISLSSLGIWALLIFLLNWAIGSNYMHLGQHNPLEIPFLPKSFTVWPWSLPSFVGVGILLLNLCYLSLNRLAKSKRTA